MILFYCVQQNENFLLSSFFFLLSSFGDRRPTHAHYDPPLDHHLPTEMPSILKTPCLIIFSILLLSLLPSALGFAFLPCRIRTFSNSLSLSLFPHSPHRPSLALRSTRRLQNGGGYFSILSSLSLFYPILPNSLPSAGVFGRLSFVVLQYCDALIHFMLLKNI